MEDADEKDEISRVTCLKNRFTREPLGNWYIEFNSKEAANNATRMDGTLFSGRMLTVAIK